MRITCTLDVIQTINTCMFVCIFMFIHTYAGLFLHLHLYMYIGRRRYILSAGVPQRGHLRAGHRPRCDAGMVCTWRI